MTYGPGDFDEELFRDLDLVLALAHRYGVRLMDDFKQVIAQAR